MDEKRARVSKGASLPGQAGPIGFDCPTSPNPHWPTGRAGAESDTSGSSLRGVGRRIRIEVDVADDRALSLVADALAGILIVFPMIRVSVNGRVVVGPPTVEVPPPVDRGSRRGRRGVTR